MTMAIALSLGLAILSVALGWVVGRWQMRREFTRTHQRAEEILEAARHEAEALKAAKLAEVEKALKVREEELERRLKRQEEKFERLEARLLKKEERLEQKGVELLRAEKSLKDDLQRLSELIAQGEALLAGERKRLEELSGLSAEQVKELLIQQVEEEAESFFAKKIRQIKERAEAEAEREARKIIATVIQRYAAEEVESSTMSHVPLPQRRVQRAGDRQGGPQYSSV
jgi:ribonuclease Y